MTAVDFISGIFFYLKKDHKITAVSDKDLLLHTAFGKLFEELDLEEFEFRLIPHPVYGDSITCGNTIYSMAQMGMVSGKRPYDGYLYLEHLPNPEDNRFEAWTKRWKDIYLYESR